jgi:crotonobetainyl-CoA:carnitine CoA-transferase CaiB-like acyl-CoA transferase
MLSPYRVLDLTDERGMLCGKILGDLGADVIKVEPPGGSPARRIGPFYNDEADPEKSLPWLALNTGKRSVCLDIEADDGQAAFRRLVETTDFVVESFSPGYMDGIGLGYAALREVNPGLIMVSITPFGQTGPYAGYRGHDIVTWAASGQMYPCGNDDRPPVRLSHPSQSFFHGGGEAAAGAMVALFHRQLTGRGQHVDVSIHECLALDAWATIIWDMTKLVSGRGDPLPDKHFTRIWPCRDGHVMWVWGGGVAGKRRNTPLVAWIDREGMCDDFLREFDWETYDLRTVTQETIDRIEGPTARFFLAHTKAELYDGAFRNRLMLYPLFTADEILADVQLAARQFWVELEHPGLGRSIPYPGAFARTSEAQPSVSRRAPLIGEHSREILGVSRPPLASSAGEGVTGAPFQGLCVIDFSWNIVAPRTTKILADFGADVIRIEHSDRLDPTREGPPFRDAEPGANRAGAFAKFNTGKLSLSLNLTSAAGVEIAKRLVAGADIVVESFAGGVISKLGLGYDELCKVNPKIIMFSTSMMGQTGPRATHPGFGWHLTATAGFFHITGWPDRDPLAPFGPYTDFIVPRFSIPLLLAALDYRRRTGRGQHLDISQYEAAVHFMAPLIHDYLANGRVACRTGNRTADAAPHGAFRCRGDDRWCAIAVFTDEEWRAFCRAIGGPSWTADARFATPGGRKEHEDELERLVEQWTVGLTPEEVMGGLQSAGVGAAVVATGEDVMANDPQLRHRCTYRELDHPEMGRHLVHGPAFRMSDLSYHIRRAPLLGEHSEYVLKEILGMLDEEIAQLVVDGVV